MWLAVAWLEVGSAHRHVVGNPPGELCLHVMGWGWERSARGVFFLLSSVRSSLPGSGASRSVPQPGHAGEVWRGNGGDMIGAPGAE